MKESLLRKLTIKVAVSLFNSVLTLQMTSRAPKAASKPHREPAPLLKAEDRKPSLKEMPSYLKEVSVALTRREELLKLRERMSSAKLILEKDPTAKPWLLSRSISNSSIKEGEGRLSRKISRESRSSAGSSSDHSED